jgi:3-oxoacyl-[acyl-carrier protein] reductase
MGGHLAEEVSRLRGQVAVVTGAGRGIGRAVAMELASLGMKLGVVARSEEELDSLVSQIGPSVLACPADVRQAAQVDRAIERVKTELGIVRVLVNSAGIYHYGLVVEAGESDFDNVVDTNLKGTFLMCRAALPGMTAAGGGDIVNIASCPGSTNTGFSPKELEGKSRDRMLQPADVAHTVRMILGQTPGSFMSEIIMRPTRKP